jgi:hypothetical protein
VPVPLDRLSIVLEAMASVDGDAPTIIDRICVAAVRTLGVSGCGISLMVDGRTVGSAGVSDPAIAAIQALQFELGEGPCLDAWTDAEPVSIGNLRDAASRWPAFAVAAEEAGVGALFAFPLRLGAIRIGVLVLYRDRVGDLSHEEWLRGVVFADVASQAVLALQAGAPEDQLHELLADEPPHWAEVHQATGMISAQLGVSTEEAFVRLRAYTFAARRPLSEVTRDVVERRLQLEK